MVGNEHASPRQPRRAQRQYEEEEPKVDTEIFEYRYNNLINGDRWFASNYSQFSKLGCGGQLFGLPIR